MTILLCFWRLRPPSGTWEVGCIHLSHQPGNNVFSLSDDGFGVSLKPFPHVTCWIVVVHFCEDVMVQATAKMRCRCHAVAPAPMPRCVSLPGHLFNNVHPSLGTRPHSLFSGLRSLLFAWTLSVTEEPEASAALILPQLWRGPGRWAFSREPRWERPENTATSHERLLDSGHQVWTPAFMAKSKNADL